MDCSTLQSPCILFVANSLEGERSQGRYCRWHNKFQSGTVTHRLVAFQPLGSLTWVTGMRPHCHGLICWDTEILGAIKPATCSGRRGRHKHAKWRCKKTLQQTQGQSGICIGKET